MSVSATSSSSNTAQLEQQLVALEKQVLQENASKTDSAKAKAQVVQQLDLQIAVIETEIQAEQAASATPTASAPVAAGKVDIKA